MKIPLLLALVGLGIGLVLPTFAQQANKPDPQLRQRLIEVIRKHDDAINHNDADAVAALYTEDAVSLEQTGPVFGREAIKKRCADRFQKVHFSDLFDTVDEDSPHIIGTDGKEVWATGGWSATIKGENFGPTQIKGFFSVIREGDDWRIRLLTTNVTPHRLQHRLQLLIDECVGNSIRWSRLRTLCKLCCPITEQPAKESISNVL